MASLGTDALSIGNVTAMVTTKAMIILDGVAATRSHYNSYINSKREGSPLIAALKADALYYRPTVRLVLFGALKSIYSRSLGKTI